MLRWLLGKPRPFPITSTHYTIPYSAKCERGLKDSLRLDDNQMDGEQDREFTLGNWPAHGSGYYLVA